MIYGSSDEEPEARPSGVNTGDDGRKDYSVMK